MPEGPEIRRAADRLARALEGAVASRVRFAFEHLADWGDALSGRRIRTVDPRGKALLTRFEGGANIYTHNQLYGRWYVMARGRTPRTTRQLRLSVETDRHAALLYSASEIEVLRDDELDSHPFLSKLGPDPLDPETTAAELQARIADPEFARRSLGALLLDQHFLGGLGNYLRTEILFAARLDPSLRPSDLTDGERSTLAESVLEITRRAYRLRGVTNDPDEVRRARAAAEPRRSYRHFAFGRGEKPCRLCDTPIARRTMAGRRIYVCPTCQPSREGSAAAD